MTTIHVSDEVNDTIDALRDEGGHSSKDSAIRELIRAYEQVDALETELRTRPQTGASDATVAAYTELGLNAGFPLPDSLGAFLTDSGTTMFRVYVDGPWVFNASLAQRPPYIDVTYVGESFLLTYAVESGRYLTDYDDTAPTGTYHIAIPTDAYEDQLVRVFGDASRIHGFVVPDDGIPSSVTVPDADNHRPTVGGWGRPVSAAEARLVFDHPTVSEAIDAGTTGREDLQTPDTTATGLPVDAPDEVRAAFREFAQTNDRAVTLIQE